MASLADPALESMNFLNEVASRYPEAISFASGRPYEGFFDTALIQEYLETFARYLRDEKGCNDAQVNQIIFQYGRTKGIIHELVARQLARDEEIMVDPEVGKPFVLLDAERRFLERAFTLDSSGRLAFPELIFSAPKKSASNRRVSAMKPSALSNCFSLVEASSIASCIASAARRGSGASAASAGRRPA